MISVVAMVAVATLVWISSFNWFLLFISWVIIFVTFAAAPIIYSKLLHEKVLKFFDYSWIAVLAISIGSMWGIVDMIKLYYQNPPELVSITEGTQLRETKDIIKYGWEMYPVKTFLFICLYVIFMGSMIFGFVLNPIFMKLEKTK
ncbi:MAG: hypothetical protein NTX34_02135 [Cytophagales bacterium]|nr:hypothetical protein [Cytophagales bacterium]